jgi:hypothetical protein
MSNRNLIPSTTDLFRNKLSKILDQLQKNKDVLPQQTQEALVYEAVRLLAVFYKTVNGPGFTPVAMVTGTSPSYEDYNEGFQTLKDDIDIIFSELENLEAVVIQQFNLFASQTNRINARVKRLSSKITNFFLYSKLPVKNSIFFSDSFTDTSKIETLSTLINSQECELNQAEGIVTLPINPSLTATIPVDQAPLINSNSNGRVGNNEDLDRIDVNNNFLNVFDDNADTWFEYERVVIEDDGDPLTLDFTVNLNSEQIVNFIRLNPNNFGTKSEVDIIDIQTSNNGSLFTSIKDDIPIAGYLTEDEENIFKLAPSTSKFAGQGLFTFTPRSIKYIRFQLQQKSPYVIRTLQGKQFRYAIGIRDIEIKKYAYFNQGEIISLPFQVNSEIKKVAIRATQSPIVDSELGSIQHQISVDNGNSWIDIDPIISKTIVGITNQPQIIDINLQSPESISTPTPINTIRWRAVIKRDDAAFNETSSSFADEILEASELKSVPLSEPWTLTLDKNPVKGSIAVLDTNFGSRGNVENKFIIGQGTGKSIKFNLPWDDLLLDREKNSDNQINRKNIARVFVGGEEWTQVPVLSGASSTDKVYRLNTEGTVVNKNSKNKLNPTLFNKKGQPPGTLTLAFGDGTTGKAPGLNDLIEILFTDERLFPISKSQHISSIQFPTSIDKSSITIYRKGEIFQAIFELTSDSVITKLPNRNIISDSEHPIVFTNSDDVFLDEKPFKNGQPSPIGELIDNGDWSIDKDRGILYSFKRTDLSPGTITYFYQEVEEVDDWDWADDLPIHKAIKIGNSDWIPQSNSIEVTLSGMRINLPDLSIVEGSVEFLNTSSIDNEDNPFLFEVPFIDGLSELSTVIKTQEKIPQLIPTPSIATFTSSVKITADTKFNVSFDNLEVFEEEVGTLVEVNSVGKYFINRTTGVVSVHTNSLTIDEPGQILYYIDDSTRIKDGSYSINYENGEIYLQKPAPITGIICRYQFSEYYIRYNIARLIDSNHWTNQGKSVIIDSNETFIRSRLPNISGINQVKPTTYQVNYKFISQVRNNIQALRDYFSPILKDYALQIVTIDSL